MTDNYVLPNGQTFLASTCGYQGSWAKAQDPMTAVEKAANDVSSDGGKVPVEVFLITEGKSWIDEAEDNRFDLGYVRAVEYASRMGKLYAATQYFQVVLKKGRFGEVGKEFTFKGLAQTVD